MPKKEEVTVLIESAQLIFKNFRGREKQYNVAGKRNFCVLLDPEMADRLANDGWNVKVTKERELDEGERTGGEPYIPVEVGYKGRPPRVVLIADGKRTDLDEDMIEMLDFAPITNVDLIFRAYDWELASGSHGRKAYLKSIYVTIEVDDLERKYADVPYSATAPALDDEPGDEPYGD